MDLAMVYVGRHYETGTVVNALAAGGFVAPHTGRAYSEALAFGLGGGIAFGHFTFEYKGYLPHVALLTRNTFDPFERILDGLGVVRDVRTVTSAERAEELLRLELDSGRAVVVWADMFSLSHNGLAAGSGMWAMLPLLVVGHEEEGFWVVDRTERAFLVAADELSLARGRVKKDRYRFMTIERVDEGRLVEGVRGGLERMLALYLDKPPAGSAKNWGKAGLAHWDELLLNETRKESWARMFEAGPRFYQAVAGAVGQPGVFQWIEMLGTGAGADRGTFALFLEEASVVLGRGDLAGLASGFRESAGLWSELAEACLPDDVSGFGEVKAAYRLLAAARWSGDWARAEAARSDLRARALEVSADWPVDLAGARRVRERLAEVLGRIRAVEVPAVEELAGVLRG